MPYCTGDAHMGNAKTADGWYYHGANVVREVLKNLVAQHGLGARRNGEKSLLLFGGSSAGARGAMVHLDYVRSMLGDAARNVDVIGFLDRLVIFMINFSNNSDNSFDSPLWIDMAPYQGEFPGFNVTTSGVWARANVTHLGTECEKQYTGAESWKCMFGQYRMPFLKTVPYFLIASQSDAFQLGENVGHKPSTSSEIDYANIFGKKTRALLAKLHASGNGQNAMFSWNCYNHATSCTAAGFDTYKCSSNKVTMSEALSKYLLDRASGDEWIDDCGSFACGSC